MLTRSIRMISQLNTLASGPWSPEGSAHLIVGTDTAHHLVDPESLLGLDPLHATSLEEALPELARRETAGWLLGLPEPGRLAPLRGPAALNHAALEVGAVVVGLGGGIGLVPYGVGHGVQWRVLAAESPRADLTAYDAERVLDQTIRRAARTLADLDVAGGSRPADPDVLILPVAYGTRQRLAAEKAYRLLVACDAALADHGSALSSFEMDVRTRQIREVRIAAADALRTAVSWEDRRDDVNA